MLKAIASWICTRAGFTLGTNAELGHWLPSDAERSILIAFNGGGATYFDLPDRIDQMVQILARAPKYMDAYDDSMAVYDVLHGIAIIDLPLITSGEDYEVQVIEAVNAPQYIGQDEKGRFMWSTNYIFKIRDCPAYDGGAFLAIPDVDLDGGNFTTVPIDELDTNGF